MKFRVSLTWQLGNVANDNIPKSVTNKGVFLLLDFTVSENIYYIIQVPNLFLSVQAQEDRTQRYEI
jgi:hypothetical protein